MNTKDIDITDLKLKVMVYGTGGKGKTTFACTFPKPYVFDFDNGMLSQRGKDIAYDTYGQYDWLKFEAKLTEFEKSCPYETLVIDSVTTMEEYLLDHLISITRKPRPTQLEWGQLVLDLADIFLRVGKFKTNIVVVAHEQIVQDEITGEVMVMPLVYGKKLPGLLPLFFDEMYRAQTGRDAKEPAKPVYQLLTTADVKYSAKSRLGVLEPIVCNPSYSLIMAKLRGGR